MLMMVMLVLNLVDDLIDNVYNARVNDIAFKYPTLPTTPHTPTPIPNSTPTPTPTSPY